MQRGSGGQQGGGPGGGRGRKGGFGAGPGGKCRCPNCGKKVDHQRGQPCYEQTCPDCGTKMTRDR